MTQDEFNAAALEVTGGPAWDIVKKGLEHDIYNTQTQVFDTPDWGAVCELKGFARGIAYCINLRELVIQSIQTAKANEALEKDNADV